MGYAGARLSDPILNASDGVYNCGVVAPSKASANDRSRMFRVNIGEINRDVASEGDARNAARAKQINPPYRERLGDDLLDFSDR